MTSGRGSTALALGALILAVLFFACAGSVGATAEGVESPRASARLYPELLPRGRSAPVALRLGFEVKPEEGEQPKIESLAIELSRHVRLQGAGLPSCPPAILFSEYVTERCARAMIGRGRVVSEIVPPEGEPVTVSGALRAYWSLSFRVPKVLALVRTGPPMHLVYVIPFDVEASRGRYGTRLRVPHMSRILGVCLGVACHWDRYGLPGIYGRISDFELSLHRRFLHGRRRESFVAARCPAPAGHLLSFPLARVRMRYGGEEHAAASSGRCKSAG